MTPEQLLREGLAVYGLPADAAVIEGLDGTVLIPKVLQPYMGGCEKLVPKR